MKFKNKEELSKAYDELEKKFTQACQELKDLKEQLNFVGSKEIWQPKDSEWYWAITTDGEFWNTCNNSDGDKRILETGNYFETREEAEKQAEYNKVMIKFRKYVEAYSEPLDWVYRYRSKYFIRFDNISKQLNVDSRTYNQDAFQIYASSEQILKDAIIYSAGSEKEFIRIVFNKGEK